MEPALPQTLFLMTDPSLLPKFDEPRTAGCGTLLKSKKTDDEVAGGAVPGDAVAPADGGREGSGRSSTVRASAKTAQAAFTDVAVGADQHAGVHPEPLSRGELPARAGRSPRSCERVNPTAEGTRPWPRIRTDCEGFHRRDFLKIGAGRPARPEPAAAARGSRRRPPTAGRGQKAQGQRASSWSGSAGGPATIDMWDLKPDAPEGIRGEFKPIDTSAAGVADQRAPAARWPRSMDKVHRRPLAAPHHPVARPGHGLHDHRQQADRRPCSTRRSARWPPSCCRPSQGVPPYVTLRRPARRRGRAGRATSAPAYNPFVVEGAGGAGGNGGAPTSASAASAADRLHARTSWRTATSCSQSFDSAFQALDKPADLVDGLDAFHQQALEILRSDKTKKAFDLDQEKPTRCATRYGTDAVRPGRAGGPPAGRGGVRFVTVSLGGWDTHSQNFNALQDPPAAAARPDAVGPDRATWTTAACSTARSSTAPASSAARRRSTRTPAATTGRGRWRCVLAGGGFKRGYAHGTTDASGMAPATEPVHAGRRGGDDLPQPGHRPAPRSCRPPTGRPIQLFREGKVVEKLLA